MTKDIQNNHANGDGDQDKRQSDYVPPVRHPQFVSSNRGHAVSIAGLVERIIEEFHIEYDDNSPALEESDTTVKRRSLVRDVAEYIFGIESVQLSLAEKAGIIQRAYSEIFSYGPLDIYFADDEVTTLSLEGEEKIAIRRGPGTELVAVEPVFDDWHHMRRIIKRLLKDAEAELRDDVPVIEAGLMIEGRPVSVNVVMPPYTPELTADIRIHPSNIITLTDLVDSDMMPTVAAELLRSIARSTHGFIVVGDTESGKTTLMSSLLALQQSNGLHSVEWTGELRLPDGATQHKVRWPVGDNAGVSFSETIEKVLEVQPKSIVLDEVRADEASAIAPLLALEDAPRQMWVVRGASEAKRIRSAIGMLARRADNNQSEVLVHALYQRLPFVIVVKRRPGRLELIEIAEWQQRHDAEYPDYVHLMAKGWDGLERTNHDIQHTLT